MLLFSIRSCPVQFPEYKVHFRTNYSDQLMETEDNQSLQTFTVDFWFAES